MYVTTSTNQCIVMIFQQYATTLVMKLQMFIQVCIEFTSSDTNIDIYL